MFPTICTIILGNKLSMSYIDKGSMAYLLATGNKRKDIILTQALFMCVATEVLIIYVTGVIVVLSNILHPNVLNIERFIVLNVVLYFLQIAISSICFFGACISNSSKTYFMIGAGVPILFYLSQTLSNMGDKLEWLKYLTLFTLFNATDVIKGEGVGLAVLTFVSVAILLFGVGVYIFSKRDLSI